MAKRNDDDLREEDQRQVDQRQEIDEAIEASLPSPGGASRRAAGKAEEDEFTSDKRWRVPRKPYEQGAAADDTDDDVMRELEEKREQLGDF